MAPSWPLQMLSRFEFKEAGKGKTTFTVTWEPIDPTPEERAAFVSGHASMTQGWSGTLEQLDQFLAGRNGAIANAGSVGAAASAKSAKRARKT